MNTATTSRKEDKRSRRRWLLWLLLLLAMLMSFLCVFCSTRLALSLWDDMLTPASLLTERQANYMGGPGDVQFVEIDPAIVTQIAMDSDRLRITPIGTARGSPVIASLLPATPTPTFIPVPTATPTPTLTPTSKPPSAPPETTTGSTPTPASIPTSLPTSVSATSTSAPPTSGPTIQPPTATSLFVPTLPPPTVIPTQTPLPLPTIPPPTAPPPPTNTPDPGPPPPPANSPPNTGNDAATLDEDTSTLIPVLANDNDPDGVLIPGSVIVIAGPANGTAMVNPATGEITYTPNPDYYGADGLIYRVCDNGGACNTAAVTITVNPVNDPPVAIDDTASTAEDSLENIYVLSNDYDPEGTPLTITTVTTPLSGTATIVGNLISYNPTPNFNGTDTFTYTISDGVLTDTGIVTVSVFAINDPPVAISDTYTTTTGITLTVSAASGVLTNDYDVDIGDTLTAIKVTDPANGSVTLNPDGSFIYIPNLGFTGIDTFTYNVEDAIMASSNIATVTITVS